VKKTSKEYYQNLSWLYQHESSRYLFAEMVSLTANNITRDAY